MLFMFHVGDQVKLLFPTEDLTYVLVKIDNAIELLARSDTIMLCRVWFHSETGKYSQKNAEILRNKCNLYALC